MHSLAPGRATPAVQQALDLIAPAQAAGWLGTTACRPDEVLCGAALLNLGSQQIPVRLVLHDNGVAALLQLLAHDLHTALYAEQFVVLAGFPDDQLIAFRKRVQHPYRRIHVGTVRDYQEWVSTRLGPLGPLPGDSPVRQLMECFLSYGRGRPPAQRVPAVGDYSHSRIAKSFDLGACGTQACMTLFSHVRGAHHVINVEGDRAWQRKDVDILVQGLAGGVSGPTIKSDVKAENFRSGNISLELEGNVQQGSPGWLRFSEMDVLISIMWPTGDVFLMDFKRVQAWALGGNHSLAIRMGKAPGQDYNSKVVLAPIGTLFDTFDDAVYLRLDEWLPEAYAGQFEHPTLVCPQYHHRRLVPQRTTIN